MKTIMVRYKTHAESVAENERLIHAVFDELRAAQPPGVSYGTFKLDDGVSFVHFAVIDTADGSNPLVSLPAFERFQTDLAERCVEMPHAINVFPVDGYRFPTEVAGA